MSVCSFPDCGRRVKARGLCQPHDRQQKKGRVLYPIGAQHTAGQVCSVHACGRVAVAKGMCYAHRRKQRLGQPLDPIRDRRTNPSGCTINGCKKQHHALGLCRTHYMASREAVRPPRPPRATKPRKPSTKPNPQPVTDPTTPRGRALAQGLPETWFIPTITPQTGSPSGAWRLSHDTIGTPIPITDTMRLNAALVAVTHGATIAERRRLLEMLGLDNLKESA